MRWERAKGGFATEITENTEMIEYHKLPFSVISVFSVAYFFSCLAAESDRDRNHNASDHKHEETC
jgi:hypothetical protein